MTACRHRLLARTLLAASVVGLLLLSGCDRHSGQVDQGSEPRNRNYASGTTSEPRRVVITAPKDWASEVERREERERTERLAATEEQIQDLVTAAERAASPSSHPNGGAEYALDTEERRQYVLNSGGVAPPGAKVTFDHGPATNAADEARRTTWDRWPNGYPAAPRSLNYSVTDFRTRETHRALRWKAAMAKGGIDKYWSSFVPEHSSLPYPGEDIFGPATENMELLRSYGDSEKIPPMHLVWSYPRWSICGFNRIAGRLWENDTVSDTLGCEPILDWSLWAIEQFVEPQNLSLPFSEQVRQVAERKLAIEVRALHEPPRTSNNLLSLGIGEPINVWWPILAATGWLRAVDSAVTAEGFAHLEDSLLKITAVLSYFGDEMDAGREPWKAIS